MSHRIGVEGMSVQEFENILADGDPGEILWVPPATDPNRTPPCINFQGLLIFAVRYLFEGLDTRRVMKAAVDFSDWPLTETVQDGDGRFVVHGGLPDAWWMMPKGLLLAWFKWYEKDKGLKLGEFKNLKE